MLKHPSIKMQAILHPISFLSSVTGTDVDQLLALSVILGTYPAALVWNKMFNNGSWTSVVPTHGEDWKKHVFSIVLSGALLVNFFSTSSLYHVLFAVGITYAITHLFYYTTVVPEKYKVYGPWLVLVVIMTQLSRLHLSEQFASSLEGGRSVFSLTAPMMVLVIKLSSYSWSVYDGYRKSLGKTMDAGQSERAIQEEPSILEWLGFCFFFGGFLAGPAFDFGDYRAFIRGNLIPKSSPSPVVATLQTLGLGMACLLVYAVWGEAINYSNMTTLKFLSLPLWKRIAWVPLFGFSARCKYYAAWKLAEGSCILCGLGFSGTETQPEWKRLTNVEPVNVEKATSLKVLLDNWNMNTQQWLKRCIFDRFPSSRTSKIFSTYFVSAIWHGFYPGYYLTFFGGGVLTAVGGAIRSLVRPFFANKASPLHHLHPLYDVATWAVTQYWLNYIVIPFVLLEWSVSKQSWANVGWYGHIGICVAWIAVKVLGKRVKKIQRDMGLILPREPKKVRQE
jgi:lysophospholipid acyltransferase